MTQRTLELSVNGMHCTGCENTIVKAVASLPGIAQVEASYEKARAVIRYDDTTASEAGIIAAIVAAGYEVPAVTLPLRLVEPGTSHSRLQAVLLFLALLIGIGAIVQWGRGMMPGIMQQMNAQPGAAMLFGLGFLTGFHCIGMCGSFVVSYVDSRASLLQSALSHAAYGGGKTLSYATLGGLFGLLGGLRLEIARGLGDIRHGFAGLGLLGGGLGLLLALADVFGDGLHHLTHLRRQVGEGRASLETGLGKLAREGFGLFTGAGGACRGGFQAGRRCAGILGGLAGKGLELVGGLPVGFGGLLCLRGGSGERWRGGASQAPQFVRQLA